MKKKTILAKKLLHIASMLIEANVLDDCIKTIDGTTRNDKEELKNYFSDNFNVSNSNDIKKMKCFTHWIKNDKTFVPDEKADMAFKIINDNRRNYQNYKTVDSVFSDEGNSRMVNKLTFNPDSEPTFKDKYNAGGGVVIYTVDDSKDGQMAIRKAADVAFGCDFNGWCIIARKETAPGNITNDISMMTGKQNEDAGLYSYDCLKKTARNFWNQYSDYPKRAAFKSGKIIAFCASGQQKIRWWDKNNDYYDNLNEIAPGAVDNPDFIFKYLKIYDFLSNRNCPVSTLREMSEDTDRHVLIAIAKNINCPEDILKKIAENGDSGVLIAVAKNKHCSKEMLEEFAENCDASVYGAIADNSNCTEDLLRKMAEDEKSDDYVFRIIAYNDKCPVDLLRKFSDNTDKKVLAAIADNNNCPEDVLDKLSGNTDKKILEAIAYNKNCPEDVLRKMSDNTDAGILEAIAYNKNCPEDVLRKMSKNSDEYVLKAISYNKKCPKDLFNFLNESKLK